MPTSFNLFQQVASSPGSKWQGAPKLRPNGTSRINIRDDYRWTISPKNARAEIPIIEFEEYELDLSSLITTALYKLRGGIENIAAFGQNATDVYNKIVGGSSSPAVKSLASPPTSSDELSPYAGMYAATPTGFRYIAPYLEELNQNINNRWGDDTGNTFDSKFGAAVKEMGIDLSGIVNTSNLANIAAPGSYAEKPKFFNPGDTDSYTIRFPLLNTFDPADIVKNWELCYLLTYQNLANRRSVNLLDPPALYRVTIPGVRQSPIAYISNLRIQYIGNLRNVEINGLRKPVPEAYMVNITFQDLLINSRNIFKYALDGQKVVATIAPSSVAQPVVSTVLPGGS